MSPSVASVRGAPHEPSLGARFGRGLARALAALLASQYLAGAVFLVSIGLPPHTATPLTVTRYASWYGRQPRVRSRLVMASAAGAAGIGMVAVIVLFPRRRPLHGAARFATRREIAQAGLLGSEGILLGRYGGRYLMLAGQQGVALAAPPRSGKGTGIVIPNALNWSGSLVCIDIKRENWTVTAGYRAACGQACFLFDPFAEDGRSARWNPLHYVSADPHRRINDLQKIAEMLFPDPPGDTFWAASARAMFFGIALYVFETPGRPKTIGEILRLGMASDKEGFGEHWKRLIHGRNEHERPLSRECTQALYDLIDLSPVTASSIRKTFTSRLDLWQNPILDAATSANDFDLRELRKRPISIYVGVNPDDLHRLRPVLALFFQQAIGLQTRELPEHNPQLKVPVMMLLDEFTALGRIPIIAEAVSYLPGYNVRVVLVIQTPSQLKEVYGINNADTMLKSLAARIVFTPKDFVDAREISEELGYTTVKARSLSRPLLDFESGTKRGRSETSSEQRRALLLPQEVKELPPEEALIFYEGLRPIRARKIRYFRDPLFRARLRPPPAVPEMPRLPPPEPPKAAVLAAPPVPAAPAVRAGTVEDIDRLKEVELEDLDLDIQQLPLPLLDEQGRVSESGLLALVEGIADQATREGIDHG